MFHSPIVQHNFLVRCKKCGENIPATVQTLPAQPIAVKCPLCNENRQYLPSDVFKGRLSYLLVQKVSRARIGGADHVRSKQAHAAPGMEPDLLKPSFNNRVG